MPPLLPRIAQALNVLPGEGRLIAALALYSFALGMAQAFYHAAASAIFLATHPAGDMAQVFIATAVFAAAAGALYAQLQKRRMPSALLHAVVLGGLALVFAAFPTLLAISPGGWPSFLLATGDNVVYILLTLVFYELVGRQLDIRQAKRLFGLAGAGEVLGVAMGGLAAGAAVSFVPTAALLYLGAIGLVAALVIRLSIALIFGEAGGEAGSAEGEVDKGEQAAIPLLKLLRGRYVLAVIGLSFAGFIAYYYVEVAFAVAAAERYPSEADLARAFGVLGALGAALTFLMRMFATGRLVMRFGMGFGLRALPLALCLLATAVVVSCAVGSVYVFWLVALIRLASNVGWSALYAPTVLLLYQPLKPSQRIRTRTLVEGMIEPVAVGIAGGLMILHQHLAPFRTLEISGVIIVITCVWIAVSFRAVRLYVAQLLASISRRSLGGDAFSITDATSLALVERFLESRHPGEVVYALDLLESAAHPSLGRRLLAALDHPAAEVREAALGRLVGHPIAAASARVHELQSDTALSVRRAATAWLLCAGAPEERRAAELRVRADVEAADPRAREGAALLLGLAPRNAQSRIEDAPALARLCRDVDSGVRAAAFKAAVNEPSLWPLVIESVSVRGAGAADALRRGRERALDDLESAIDDAAVDLRRRRHHLALVRVYASVRTPRTLARLAPLLDAPDHELRALALASYRLAGKRLGAAHGPLHDRLRAETAVAAWAVAAADDVAGGAAVELLCRALDQEFVRARARVFAWLALYGDPGAISRAEHAFTSPRAEGRANAVELLDNLLQPSERAMVLPLLETLSRKDRRTRLEPMFPGAHLEPTARLTTLATAEETWTPPWVRTCALHALIEMEAAPAALLATFLANPDAHLRETALHAQALAKEEAC